MELFLLLNTNVHRSEIFILFQEALKSRQKDVKDGEAAVSAAHEARGKAEAKLNNAKAEHEKALKRAKAAGVVPELPSAVEAEKA